MRSLAWGAVCAGLALPLVRRRLGVPPAATVAAVVAAPFGLAVAAPRSRSRDVAIYALQMWAFIVVHELPYDRRETLERRVHVRYPIACDRVLGLGVPPTVRLQRALRREAGSSALDQTLVWVHWLWFLEPHAAAAWVLWRRPERFARSALLICAPFDLGAVLYFAVPTAPPWWAGEQGMLPDVRRIMEDVGRRFWGRFWPALYDFLGGNPLAAMPSLHFATSLMAAKVLSELGPLEAAVGWSYAGTLAFALVYLGEHYVVDLLVGGALTGGVWALAPRATPVLARVSRAVQGLERAARS